MAPAVLYAVPLLLALLAPGPTRAVAALSVPPNGISGCTVIAAGGGGVTSAPADVQSTPVGTDQVDVMLAATASDAVSFAGLYEGEMSYDCALLGAGSLGYGEATGSLTLTATSTPDALPPTPQNQGNPPFSNDGAARGEGVLTLQFDDTGTVTSDVLAPGTPVQLEITFLLHSVGIATGAPPGPLLSTAATYFVRAVDTAAPGAPLERILSGSEIVTGTLDTAVGRTVDLQGRLVLHVLARAGREVSGAPYYGDLDASIDASNTSRFTISTPANVSFVAESGHDYTAPAPSQGLLVATGALVLAVARRRRDGRARRLSGRGLRPDADRPACAARRSGG